MSNKYRGLSAILVLIFSASLIAGGPASNVVINEIDYDQPGSDTTEFIELYNPSAVAVSLNGYVVEIINGTGGGASVALSINLPNVMLAANDYFVICTDAITPSVPNCDFDGGANNLIQNGAPDAVGLRDSANVLLDAVSYEGNSGAPYTETAGAPGDTGDGSISRLPNGTDTNDNSADFVFQAITPGASNSPPMPMISIDDVTQAEGDAGTSTFDFTVSIDVAADATVQVDTADGTATTADSDYVAIAAQTVTFTAMGATTQTVSVTVNGDTVIEGNETFNVNLTNAVGATILDNQGLGTINNDDNTQAILSAVKSVSGDLSPGGLIAYDIVISNTGPNAQNDNAGDEMTDTLPASMSVQSVSATSGTATNVGNVVSWNGTVPAMGSVTVTINALIDSGAAGSIENQAQVFYDNDGDNTNESNALSAPPMSMGPAPTAFFIPFMIPSMNVLGLILLSLTLLLYVSRRKFN
jgi:uncharacterized repeat protein (TIGR01451 family)